MPTIARTKTPHKELDHGYLSKLDGAIFHNGRSSGEPQEAVAATQRFVSPHDALKRLADNNRRSR